MKDIFDYYDQVKRKSKEWWARSLGVVVIAVVSFFSGNAYQSKQITDDCKFMGSFRDGTQAYNCQQRVR